MNTSYDRIGEVAADGDALDRVLAVAWIVSEIAIDVFGMLFWSGLGMCLLWLLTHPQAPVR